MLFDTEKVKQFLPHRDPFLFIDSIEKIIVPGQDFQLGYVVPSRDFIGTKIIGNFYTDPTLSIFKGHFPGKPVLPGVVQIEMIAQASSFGMICLHETPFDLDLNLALMSVSNSKFRKPILPDMHLKIETICVKLRGSIMSYQGHIYHENELMSEAFVMASVKH